MKLRHEKNWLTRAAVALATAVLALGGQAWAQSAQDLNHAAHGHYEQGRYAEAIALLERSVRIEPSGDSHFGLALCYLQTGALHEAHKNFSRAAQIDAKYVPGLRSLADIYMNPQDSRFDVDKAKVVLEEARALVPDDRITLSKLGEIYFLKSSIGIDSSREEMARYRDLAEKVLRQVLQLDPGQSRAHMLLGQIHGTRGQFNSAILEFQNAVKANPANYQAWLYLGMDYYRIGLFDEAAQAFRTAGKSSSESVREASEKYLQRIEQLQARRP